MKYSGKIIKNIKENKKLILKILFTIIIMYVIYCLFKFILLLTCYIRANNISNYDNYRIDNYLSIHEKIENETSEYSECYIYINGIQQIEYYDFEDYLGNGLAQKITYINPDKNKAYGLKYNEELEKYIYEDLTADEREAYEEYGNNRTTLKNMTLSCIPNIISATIDPRVKVWFDDTYFYIESNKKEYSNISIDRNTGILTVMYTTSDIKNKCTVIHLNTEELQEEINSKEPIECEKYIKIEELYK